MHRPFLLRVLASLTIALYASVALGAPERTEEASADEQALRSAGFTIDGPALLEFFRARAQLDIDSEKIVALTRKLGDSEADVRARAATALVARGPLAIPALRHIVNDLSDPVAAGLAQQCLQTIEGPESSSLLAAAARVLAVRKPEGAGEALLTYLPFADNAHVADQVRAAVAEVAFPGGKADPAVLRALQDPVPLRRAVAAEALCRADQPDQVPSIRKLLRDPNPSVRLRTALALAKQQDAVAVPVLIELLGEAPVAQRKQAEEVLLELAGEWAPSVGQLKEDDISRRIYRDAWAAWWRNTDGPALLAEFRKRTLGPEQRKKIEAVVEKLGANQFATRERASADVIAFGHLAVPFLREAVKGKDLERSRRAETCLERIARGEGKPLPAVAARLLVLRKPAGAAEVLLDYLPWADADGLGQEIQEALVALAVRDGKTEPALVKALEDPMSVRRLAALEALTRRGGREHRTALRELRQDADPTVRVRVLLALLAAQDREVIPAIIEGLTDLPPEQAGQAEEALRLLAGEKAPEITLGPGRYRKCREAWETWWRDNGAQVDLARADSTRTTSGYTLLVEVDDNGIGRVREVDRENKVRWSVDSLQYPVDAYVLPGNRILVAEYNGRRVSERDLKGNILWKKENLPGNPTNAQRLANGNTFIVTDVEIMEVDRTGQAVFSHRFQGDTAIAGWKAPNGDILCLMGQGFCVRMDARGKELKRFSSNRGPGWTSGIDGVPGGKVLVAQPDRNQVAEFDPEGKAVLELAASGVTTATWLPNGHALTASYGNMKAIELDRAGKTVWQFNSDRHIFRARRR